MGGAVEYEWLPCLRLHPCASSAASSETPRSATNDLMSSHMGEVIVVLVLLPQAALQDLPGHVLAAQPECQRQRQGRPGKGDPKGQQDHLSGNPELREGGRPGKDQDQPTHR